MPRDEEEDQRIYTVVVNHEDQYSIWFADRQLPLGWREVGKQGLKSDCLAYIKEVWTDMRPLSLRKQMAERAGQQEG
ncbi:MAG: MbtH family protein [Ktedonobacteraceae bacterium]|jgi:MbtH protein